MSKCIVGSGPRNNELPRLWKYTPMLDDLNQKTDLSQKISSNLWYGRTHIPDNNQRSRKYTYLGYNFRDFGQSLNSLLPRLRHLNHEHEKPYKKNQKWIFVFDFDNNNNYYYNNMEHEGDCDTNWSCCTRDNPQRICKETINFRNKRTSTQNENKRKRK